MAARRQFRIDSVRMVDEFRGRKLRGCARRSQNWRRGESVIRTLGSSSGVGKVLFVIDAGDTWCTSWPWDWRNHRCNTIKSEYEE